MKFMDEEYAGKVALSTEGAESAYDHRLVVMTKFRKDAPLQQLSVSNQSGGERSVATMMFVLALQRLSCAPFRVVDEINQGLDAKNERKMFELITTIADPFLEEATVLAPPNARPAVAAADDDRMDDGRRGAHRSPRSRGAESDAPATSRVAPQTMKQYVILTPQVVSGVKYRRINVCYVHNGPGISAAGVFSGLSRPTTIDAADCPMIV
eukprot:Selendium_serpulae@DN9518_c0_g1_i1.p1